MYLLKKVFQLRDYATPDDEKPFLDHLEDLRVMVFKVVITLLISIIACFGFNKQLMHLLQKPVKESMWVEKSKKLPKGISVETWDLALKADKATAALSPEQREHYYHVLNDPAARVQAEIVPIFRSTLSLPDEKREAYLTSLKLDPGVKERVKTLLSMEHPPAADISGRGDLSMMSTLKPTESFMLSMKLAFFAGIVVAFPLLLMFILQFILPGLHRHEQSVLWPALAVGFGLFLTGVFFAFHIVLPRTLEFFQSWSQDMGIANDWRIGEYMSFATQFTLLFGLSFELPVVVMVIVKLGLLSYSTMSKTRAYAIVGILILAAVLTPTPDVFTLLVMAGPMIILYEICIWLAWFDERKAKRKEEAEAKERMERLLRNPHVPHTPAETDIPESADDGWKEEHPPYEDYHAAYQDDYHRDTADLTDETKPAEAKSEDAIIEYAENLPEEKPPEEKPAGTTTDDTLADTNPDVPESGERRRLDG